MYPEYGHLRLKFARTYPKCQGLLPAVYGARMIRVYGCLTEGIDAMSGMQETCVKDIGEDDTHLFNITVKF
jgi:hypothetical protein